ncbi:glycosyl hydrolase family 61-domain-containing protein [Triangularia verruculosa]|uniref:lytic cellulose monooxygenase (C4-dehydrogenating) n=1 Tax=Triangularia verruculosa TaxID=2587418 RepID=A0AAN6X8C5_9PEZI|nr:glycosyl hydrolase family 61-domain-containing protein [Triangularia verruculosa]
MRASKSEVSQQVGGKTSNFLFRPGLVSIRQTLDKFASVHFLFPHLMLNGVRTGAYEYVREHDFGFMPHNNDFINHPDFRSGRDTVGFNLHLDFKIYHPGPVTIYFSKALGDVRDYDGLGEWFKVYQLGTMTPWNGTDQGWLTRDKPNFQFRLPAEIPAGEYLMRIEQMSVHPPYRQKEWYIQCAHLKIASNYNGRAPGPTIRFPGGY